MAEVAGAGTVEKTGLLSGTATAAVAGREMLGVGCGEGPVMGTSTDGTERGGVWRTESNNP